MTRSTLSLVLKWLGMYTFDAGCFMSRCGQRKRALQLFCGLNPEFCSFCRTGDTALHGKNNYLDTHRVVSPIALLPLPRVIFVLLRMFIPERSSQHFP